MNPEYEDCLDAKSGDIVLQASGIARTYQVRQRRPKSLRQQTIFVEALRGIDLTVRRSETTALIGPNGAGKSTAVKIIVGLLPTSAGNVRVCGLDPWRHRAALSHHIGVVMGNRTRLWYSMTVLDGLRLLCRMYGIRDARDERIAQLARHFDCYGYLDRPLKTLSLGQRVRADLVAALLHSPKLLVLDEPTVGLDVVGKQVLREHIATLAREEGLAVLLTSHDTNDIEHLAEQVVVMDEGRVVFQGSLADLARSYSPSRRISIRSAQSEITYDAPGVAIVTNANHELTLDVDTSVTSVGRVVSDLLARFEIVDLQVGNQPLEKTISRIYKREQNKSERTSGWLP